MNLSTLIRCVLRSTRMDDMAQYWSEYPWSEVDGQVPSVLPVGRYVSVVRMDTER